VVWGGIGGRPQRTALPDGALFSIREWRWEVLPPAPLDPRSQPSLVSDRERLFLWGGFKDRDPLSEIRGPALFADGAEYLFRSRTWHRLPSPPLAPRANHVAFGAGQGFGVWGGDEVQWHSHRAPRAFSDGARYDPLLRRWTPLAACPLPPRHFRRVLWTGKHLLVWGGSDAPEEMTGRREARGDAVDPPVDARPVRLHEEPEAAAYDPEDDNWMLLPAPPQLGVQALSVWIDGRVILLGLDGSTMVWDAFEGTWRSVPPAPIHPRVLAHPATFFGRLQHAALALVPERNGRAALMRAWVNRPADRRWEDAGLTPITPRLDAAVAVESNTLVIWSGARASPPAPDPLQDGFLLTSAPALS
jgi:hypothetical protein